MTDCIPDSISILGTKVSVFESYDQAVQLIRRRIAKRVQTFCIAINPEKVYRARNDAALNRVLESGDIRICDGVGVSIASLLLHRTNLARCTGVDLFLRLMKLSAQEGWKVFLLGASPESNARAAAELVNRFPGLKIAGTQHGFFTDNAEVVQRINESGADLLFVALGSPRQEYWLSEQMPRLNPSFCMGVGGSLDVVSGAARRAPAVFRKTGTEWLFRLLSQPSRLSRQIALPLFTWAVLKEMRSIRH
jgi:N-acetylglucosaminyldiphosphoundecaprenol N-acetyl-beta-D-mannosaminyltransferase